MAITFDELKSRLTNVKPTGANSIKASCPCKQNHKHEDKTQSFFAKYDASTRRILVFCQRGCSIDEICGELGCSVHDLTADKSQEDKLRSFAEWMGQKDGLRLVAMYSYCYGAFRDGLTKVKYTDSDGNKTFRWMKEDNTTKSGFKMTHTGCPYRMYMRGNPGNDSVFIAEGEKDADTLFRLTGQTAACTENGASEADTPGKWRAEYNEQLKGKTVFLLWDNDETGKAWAKIEAKHIRQCAARLYELDITTVWPECPDKGDITDMAQALGDEETKNRLRALIKAAKEAPEAPQDAPQQEDEQTPTEAQEAAQTAQEAPLTAEQLFDSFLADIQTEKFRPIPTGIEELDALLGGGILRQSLLILSAAPGTGKTTVAQQIFETMAAHGTDVIFLNLEMSREQLLARSMSRMIHKRGNNMTAAQVLKGYEWTDYQKQYVTAAAQEYRETIAPRMKYNPERCTTDIESIRATLTAAGKAARDAGKPGPVCVLDYIHLITTGKREEQGEILKKAVAMLKEYAREYDTFVFAISANNRTSNESGKVTLASGRDTSAIEYSADYQLGLNYKAFTEKLQRSNGIEYKADNPDDLEELQAQTPRHMTIQVLKNRMNASGGKIFLDFDAANSTFTFAGRPEKRRARTLNEAVRDAATGMTRIEDDPNLPFL